MKHYHSTFKLIIVERILNKIYSVIEGAFLYKISRSTIYNWINLYKSNKLFTKKKYKRIKYKFSVTIFNFINAYVKRDTNFNYKILINLILYRFNLIISKSSIYNILAKLNFTKKKIRKKKIYGNRKKLTQKINTFKETVNEINKNDIISIDEVSFDTNLYPNYGWSKKGTRLFAEINASRKRYTVICAVSNKTIIGYKIVRGSANAVIFLDFIKNILKNVKNKYILLDNARIHHTKIVKEYMNTITNKLLFNVPYYPEFNPIEKVFSIIKPFVRSFKDNENNLLINIQESFNQVSDTHLKSFYKQSLELFK